MGSFFACNIPYIGCYFGVDLFTLVVYSIRIGGESCLEIVQKI